MKVIDYLFSDKDGAKVYGQKPNTPVIVAGIFYALAFFTDGTLSASAGWIGRFAMLYWAYLEITSGVNRFRRLLGITVAVFIVLGQLRPFLTN